MYKVPPAPHDDMHCLYRDHSGWLQGWLRRRLGDRERAADLAQDTFVRLIASTVAHPLREPRNFLATVAKRVMVDEPALRFLRLRPTALRTTGQPSGSFDTTRCLSGQ